MLVSVFAGHFSSDDYLYKVDPNQVKCLTCPPEENEYQDVESATIPATPDTPPAPSAPAAPSTKAGKLVVDQNGVIIKK